MSTYFFIKSKLNGDFISRASHETGALLGAAPKESSELDNQLWEFVADPGGSPYFFIVSKLNGDNVIEMQSTSTPTPEWGDRRFSSALHVNDIERGPTRFGPVPHAYNQLWEFVADPAGSGYFFIVSKLNGNVVEIQRPSTSTGAWLDAYPWKFTGYDNQLWAVVDGSFPSVVETVPEPLGGYSGSANYIFASGPSCAILTNVKAIILITEDLVWESSDPSSHPGFSIQLNAETNSNQTLDWLQFMLHIGDDQGLWPWINIWSGGSNPGIVWNQSVAEPVATMPQAACIPAGYSIAIALQNDPEGRVTGATWAILDSSGNSAGDVTYPLSTADGGGVAPINLSTIASFQVTIGGSMDGAHATFSSGEGVIILQADQPMNVDPSYPACIGYIDGTAETSNIGYGALGAKPSRLFSQAFGVVADNASMQQAKPNARKLTAPAAK